MEDAPAAEFVRISDHLRVAVRCALHIDGHYLFIDLCEDGDPFVIPAGGGMEYGEHSLETAIREIREELGVDVQPLFLGVVENHFTHHGMQGHTIEFLYIADVDAKVAPLGLLEMLTARPESLRSAKGERFAATPTAARSSDTNGETIPAVVSATS